MAASVVSQLVKDCHFKNLNYSLSLYYLVLSLLWILKMKTTYFSPIHFILNFTCPSKKNCVIFFIESPLKIMKKCFSFHLESLFRSQDYLGFCHDFLVI